MKRFSLKALLLLFIVSHSSSLYSQGFQKFYNQKDSGTLGISGIISANDEIIMVGSSLGKISGEPTYYISKLDGSGNVLWSIFLNDTNENMGIAVLKLNNFIIAAGDNYNSLFPDTRSLLINKFSNNGDTIFGKKYGGNMEMWAVEPGIKQVDSNDFVVLANTVIGTGLFKTGNVHLVKFDSDGNPVWGKTVGTSGNSFVQPSYASHKFYDIEISNQRIYCVGAVSDSLTTNFDGIISKFTADGDPIWNKYYFFGHNEELLDGIVSVGNGDLLVTGRGDATNTDSSFIMKINSNGEILWQKGFFRNYSYYADPIITPHGYYLLGSSMIPNPPYQNSFIIKLSPSGELLWSKEFVEKITSFTSWELSNSGKIVISGVSNYYFPAKGIVIKTDTSMASNSCNFKPYIPIFYNLNLQSKFANLPIKDTIYPIQNIPQPVPTITDIEIYCIETGIEEFKNDQISIYPNPFSDRLNFKFPVIVSKEIKIEIIEIATGRVVISKAMGKENISFSTNDIASGVYLARVTEGNKVIFWEKVVCIRE